MIVSGHVYSLEADPASKGFLGQQQETLPATSEDMMIGELSFSLKGSFDFFRPSANAPCSVCAPEKEVKYFFLYD
jgi:hypothetical protein